MELTRENAKVELSAFMIRHDWTQQQVSEKSGVSVKKLIYGEPVKQEMIFIKLNSCIHKKEGDR
jgi:hypothetical protein